MRFLDIRDSLSQHFLCGNMTYGSFVGTARGSIREMRLPTETTICWGGRYLCLSNLFHSIDQVLFENGTVLGYVRAVFGTIVVAMKYTVKDEIHEKEENEIKNAAPHLRLNLTKRADRLRAIRSRGSPHRAVQAWIVWLLEMSRVSRFAGSKAGIRVSVNNTGGHSHALPRA